MLTGTGFAQPISGKPPNIATSGNSTVPIEIDVHDRIQRHAAEQPRRRIAEPVRRPGVRRFVDRQREQEHDERDEDLREVVYARQGRYRLWPACEKRKDASARFRADQRGQLFARGPPHAGEAAERVSSCLRRRGPMPGTLSSSERRSRIVRARRWKVTANRCASSRIRWISSSAGSCAASAIGST